MLGENHLLSYRTIPPGNYDHRAANLIPVTSDAHRKTKSLRMPPQSYRLSSLDGKSGLLDLSLRFPPSQQRRHLELYENHRSYLGVTIEDTFGPGRFCGDEGCGECWEGREHLS